MDEEISRAQADAMVFAGDAIPNITPGEILKSEFMVPLGLTAKRLAAELGVPTNRVTKIVRGERAISAATALRLGRRFGVSPEFWMNLQVAHDLEAARLAERAA